MHPAIPALAAAVVALLWFFLRNPSPARKLARLRKEVAPKDGIVFETVLQGKPAAFLLLNCQVFLLDLSRRKIRRTRVLKPGFYFGLTCCTGQSIRAEDGFVIAVLKNRAIGAGGGNTSGGTYRSRDGINWEKYSRDQWLPVEEAQH